jgi:2-iminobutanoate/2-iminopropanoate deaminase
MSELEFIRSPAAPEAIGPYSQAVVSGNLVFCSGQIPLVPSTGELRNANIQEAMQQTLQNLRAVLASAGCQPCDVVKTTVYMASLDEFKEMNAEFAEFFGSHRPARATVQVSRLPAGVRVEIDCIAVRPTT